MTTTTVTRTKVHDLTREIRREAKEIDKTIEACHLVGQRGGLTLPAFLQDDTSEYARGRLHELLSVIEGNAAWLRELLNAEDV